MKTVLGYRDSRDIFIKKIDWMNQQIQMRNMPLKLEYSDQESTPTDYGDDPHVYGHKWEYIMSAIGVCVGFGAFWRFPYLVYKNGGGVFLIPYTLSLVLVGVPLLYFQVALGQMFRVSTPFIFQKLHPSLKIIGIGIMTATFHFSSSYNILLAYCYRFMFAAFSDPLPFADQSITDNRFFHEDILQQSASINQYQAINPALFVLYIFSMLLCHYIVKDGAKTSGKVVIITASTPFVIFFILVIRGLFLSGAWEGIVYLFTPTWSKLWSYQIWIDATTQVFYQLTLGIGTMITLSNAKPRREDLLQSVYLVPVGLFLCGILSALTIFIYLSHFCQSSEYSIGDPRLQLSGIELSFNVLPKALMMLPMPNLWIFIFFAAMVLLGVDSEFGLMEALYGCVRDQFKLGSLTLFGVHIDAKKGQYLMLAILCIGAPTLSSHAGIYYLQFYDYFMGNIPFTVWILVELYFFVHVFPLDELTNAILRYTKVPTPPIIIFCLKSYWLPGILLANLFFATYNQILMFRKYTMGYYLFGWLFTLYPGILIYFVLRRTWPGWGALKLTFAQIEDRSSYF